MRIVAHNGATIWGGAERALSTLLEGLGSRGHDVLLLCNADLVASKAREKGIPAGICVLGGDAMIPHSFRLANTLRTTTPDAFVIGTYKKLFLASLGARLARVPRVVARIGLETDTPRNAKYRFALRHWTNGVAVNAERMVSPFANLSGFGADKVELIHNGVGRVARKGIAGAVRKEIGIDPDAFVIGTVARLARQKRLDRLLAVVSSLPQDVQCVIAGNGEERSSLELLASKSGIAHRVHFIGERTDVADVLDALDVFVITSDREGLANSMLEAMSAGLPVVSTPVSGAEDALGADARGDVAGILTDFSTESIVAAILALLESAPLRVSVGESAERRAGARFSMETMLDKWEYFLSPAPRR